MKKPGVGAMLYPPSVTNSNMQISIFGVNDD